MKYSYYKDRSEANKKKYIPLFPIRGDILDRSKVHIAKVVDSHSILLRRTTPKDDLRTIKKIANILGLASSEVHLMRREYYRNKDQEVLIYNYLTRRQLIVLEFHIAHIPNVEVYTYLARVYTQPMAFAHVLGYLGAAKNTEGANSKLSGFLNVKTGASGLEKTFESTLRGEYGIRVVEVDAIGNYGRSMGYFPPKKGQEVQTSLDSQLQQYMFYRGVISGFNMSATVMDITTGEVLSMVSLPSFDANTVSRKTSQEEWAKYIEDPGRPFNNRAIRAGYAPGSIFKLVSALAALESGSPISHKVQCNGTTYILGMKKHCWKEQGHGSVNMLEAIEGSCNIYFYNIARRFPKPEAFSRIAKELGLGQYFEGLEIPGQTKGIVPDSNWKLSSRGRVWYPGDTVNLAIGQGFLSVNCLQIATMMARIATVGTKVTPTLLKVQAPPSMGSIKVSRPHMKFIKRAMYGVVNKPSGTAYYARLRDTPHLIDGQPFVLSGKTGTSQVFSKFQEEYEDDALKPHGLFGGFAPLENPKYSIAVICDNCGSSSKAAAIARDVMQFVYYQTSGNTDKVQKNLSHMKLKAENILSNQQDSR